MCYYSPKGLLAWAPGLRVTYCSTLDNLSFCGTPNFKLLMLALFPTSISRKFLTLSCISSAHTAQMCQYFALLLFQLMPNLNKSAVILWKCNNPLFVWITLAESKRKKLFGATMELINDALERRCFGSSIMLKWCKGFSIQLTLSRVYTMGLVFFLKYDYHVLVYKIYIIQGDS